MVSFVYRGFFVYSYVIVYALLFALICVCIHGDLVPDVIFVGFSFVCTYAWGPAGGLRSYCRVVM